MTGLRTLRVIAVLAIVMAAIVPTLLVLRHRSQSASQRQASAPESEASTQTYSVSKGSENGVPEEVAVPKLAVRVPRSASASSGPSAALPQIAKSAQVDLIVANVDTATTQITALAHQVRGDVFSLDSSNETNGKPAQSADATIRVPADTFDRTLQRLSALGTVRSSSVKAEDLTANITDSSARLRNLKRTEQDILHIMDRSGNVEQIMDVETQLSQVREQIETLEADVASMRRRVAYATIDIHAQAETQRAPAEPSALARVTNAFVAARHRLSDSIVRLVSGVIWLAVVDLPYLLAAAVALWCLRLGLRKYAVRR